MKTSEIKIIVTDENDSLDVKLHAPNDFPAMDIVRITKSLAEIHETKVLKYCSRNNITNMADAEKILLTDLKD